MARWLGRRRRRPSEDAEERAYGPEAYGVRIEGTGAGKEGCHEYQPPGLDVVDGEKHPPDGESANQEQGGLGLVFESELMRFVASVHAG